MNRLNGRDIKLKKDRVREMGGKRERERERERESGRRNEIETLRRG